MTGTDEFGHELDAQGYEHPQGAAGARPARGPQPAGRPMPGQEAGQDAPWIAGGAVGYAEAVFGPAGQQHQHPGAVGQQHSGGPGAQHSGPAGLAQSGPAGPQRPGPVAGVAPGRGPAVPPGHDAPTAEFFPLYDGGAPEDYQVPPPAAQAPRQAAAPQPVPQQAAQQSVPQQAQRPQVQRPQQHPQPQQAAPYGRPMSQDPENLGYPEQDYDPLSNSASWSAAPPRVGAQPQGQPHPVQAQRPAVPAQPMPAPAPLPERGAARVADQVRQGGAAPQGQPQQQAGAQPAAESGAYQSSATAQAAGRAPVAQQAAAGPAQVVRQESMSPPRRRAGGAAQPAGTLGQAGGPASLDELSSERLRSVAPSVPAPRVPEHSAQDLPVMPQRAAAPASAARPPQQAQPQQAQPQVQAQAAPAQPQAAPAQPRAQAPQQAPVQQPQTQQSQSFEEPVPDADELVVPWQSVAPQVGEGYASTPGSPRGTRRRAEPGVDEVVPEPLQAPQPVLLDPEPGEDEDGYAVPAQPRIAVQQAAEQAVQRPEADAQGGEANAAQPPDVYGPGYPSDEEDALSGSGQHARPAQQQPSQPQAAAQQLQAQQLQAQQPQQAVAPRRAAAQASPPSVSPLRRQPSRPVQPQPAQPSEPVRPQSAQQAPALQPQQPQVQQAQVEQAQAQPAQQAAAEQSQSPQSQQSPQPQSAQPQSAQQAVAQGAQPQQAQPQQAQPQRAAAPESTPSVSPLRRQPSRPAAAQPKPVASQDPGSAAGTGAPGMSVAGTPATSAASTPAKPAATASQAPAATPAAPARPQRPKKAAAAGVPAAVAPVSAPATAAPAVSTRAVSAPAVVSASVVSPSATVAPGVGRAPAYGDDALEAVYRVIRERRDIRNDFLSDELPAEVLTRILEAAHTAPSVGFSQPWDFLVLKDEERRRAVHDLAARQRRAYAASLPKARAKAFAALKIEAILDTPVNIVVTCDPTRGGRHTLGRYTQPMMAPFSTCLAVENLWLAARAEGLGVGWVSFFDERELAETLGLPAHLQIVAYLCVGYVKRFPAEPELVGSGWARRRPLSWAVHEDDYGRRALPGGGTVSLLDATVDAVRGLDEEATAAARDRQARMTKPPGSLGMLETVAEQLSGLAGQCPPPLPEPAALAVFAADHGVHAQGVTPWPQEVTAQMVNNFLAGGAVVNAFAKQVGAEVCVVDVGVAANLGTASGLVPRKVRMGTADMTQGPAMSREEATTAIEAGIETARDLVAAGNRCLLTGDMGIANTTASAALIAAFTGASPAQVTGYGTGIDEQTYAHKVEIVRRALQLHRPDPQDPIGVLSAFGGLEHAALAGFILGAAALRVPVVLDGVIAGAAALVAQAIAPEVTAACVAGHRSAEPGHALALEALGVNPLIDLELRLGEGSGAVLALPLVAAAVRALREVATFDAAGVADASAAAVSPAERGRTE